MFDDLAAYYHEHVVSSYIAYRDISKDIVAGRSRDLREALSASNALFHFREHLPDKILSRGQVEQLCFDYALLGDIVNASKHKLLTTNTPHGIPLVNDAASIGEQILLIEYEDDAGIYRYTAKTVVVNLIDGTERNLLEVLTNVINFWEQHMVSLGILSVARTFSYDDPACIRTRAQCESSRLDFQVVQGQRFKQSIKMLRFDNATGQSEPIDLTGSEINFRIYRPKFDLDIFLTYDATGAELKKTITLSEFDSLELSKLSTDAEKQVYINTLPEVQEIFRELAVEAGKEIIAFSTQ